MTVLRINKREKNFLIIDKTCLTDITLSWGAKGLHAYLMSLPHDWSVKVSDLINRATNGRDSVRGLLKELEEATFISKEWLRDKVTGKYSCLEYVIHELPQKETMIEGPGTGNPETAFPSPAKPATEKPTLININNTKDINNKGLTAANKRAKNLKWESKNAAAVFSKQNTSTYPTTSSAEDSVIGSVLTVNQQMRIDSLIQQIKIQLNLADPEMLADEIRYCLLSQKHFTACDQDFGKKLNAIRKVILRGEWQTPAGMVFEVKEQSSSLFKKLENELREAYAEVNHFQRLLVGTQGRARESFETIVKNAQQKINHLESEIQQCL